MRGTAFASGFQMGQSAYQQALDEKDRQERRKLDAEERALRMQHMQEGLDATRRQADREKQIDSLVQDLTNPNAQNYTLGGTASGGLRMPTQSAAPAQEQPLDGSGLAPVQLAPSAVMGGDSAAGGLRMPGAGSAAPSGLRVPDVGALPAATFKAAPTRGAAEDILGRIALLRGDTTGFRNSQDRSRSLGDEDMFNAKVAEYTGAPDQVGPTAGYLNQTSKRITMSNPDKNGMVRVSVVQPDASAEFMKLSRSDQARLYAAGHLMNTNPTRALEIISGVNKDLAAAVAADNGLTMGLAGNANDVAGRSATITHQVNQDRNAAAQTDIQRGTADVTNRLHGAQIDEIKAKTAARTELEKIHADLNSAVDAGDAKAEDAARKKLMAYATGSKGAQHMSALEQRANLYLASGKAKTMADALELANTKVQSSAKDDYLKLTTSGPMPLQGDALATAMTTLHGPDWAAKVRGESDPAPKPLANVTDADVAATAQRYGISEAEVRKRLNIK